ncbi:MAG: PAS domain S-box protein [Actinomycetota bacterium]
MTAAIQSILDRSLSILLIEDHQDDVELIEELLFTTKSKQELELTTAVRVKEAIELLQQESFDVMLLDLDLPDSQGIETITQVSEYSAQTPIVVLTSHNDEELAVQSIQAGAQDYLVKRRIDSSTLIRCLRYAIERHQSQKALQQSEEKYRSVVESISEVIFQTDVAGNWLFLNPAWTEITGFTVSESLGVPFLTYITPEDRVETSQNIDKILKKKQETCRIKIRFVTQKRASRWLEMQARLMWTADRQVAGITGTLRDVTEETLARQQLEELTQFQQALLNSANYAIISTAIDGTIRTFNAAAEHLLGYTASEVVGVATSTLFHDPIEIAQHTQKLSVQLGAKLKPGFSALVAKAQRGEIEEGEWTYIRKDSSQVPVLLSVSPVRDRQDTITGFMAIASNITERKQAELEIHLLLAATQAISQSPDFDAALAATLRLLCEAIGWDFAEAWIPATSSLVLECSGGWYASDPALEPFRHQSQQLTFAKGEGLPGRIWATGQPEWIEDLTTVPSVTFLRSPLARANGFKAGFGLPIVAQGQVLAVMVFFKRARMPQTLHFLELVRAIATQLGWHIQRKQAEEALRQSEERFRSLVENLPGAIYRCQNDATRTADFISDEIQTISGYAASDFIGNQRLSVAQLVHPEDAPLVERQLQTALALRQPYNLEYRLIDADRTVRWIAEQGRAAYSASGDVLWLDGMIFDISARKQAELALLRVTQAVESASDAIAITDGDGNSIYHNQTFITRYGYTVEELNTLGGPTALYAKQKVLRQLFKTLRQGKPWHGEVQLKAKSGEIVQAQVRADCILDPAGYPIGMMAVITDLTELKQTESALRLSQQRLQMALEGSALGMWDWNISSGETYFDPQWKKMLGYEVEEVENNYQAWERLIYPADLPKVLAALKAYLEGRTTVYEIEFQMLSKAGTWQWILAVGQVVERDEWGSPLRMVGTHKDISHRQAAEAEKTHLIASLQQLAGQLQEAQRIARIGNWEWDAVSGTQIWSEQMFQIYEREMDAVPEFEELVEQIYPEDRQAFVRVVERAKTLGIPYNLDHRICLPSGEIRFINAKGQALKNEAGQVLRLFGTVMDISDRKFAEQAVAESEQRFRAIFESAAIGIAQVWPDGQFLKVNSGLCQILGYTESELRQHTFLEISHPEDLAADLEQQRLLLLGEIQSYAIEKRFIRANGEPIWTHISVSLVREPRSGEPKYFVKIVEDVSDRKALEREVALRENRLNAFFACAPVGLTILDTQLRFVQVNEVLAQMNGIAVANHLGKSVGELLPDLAAQVEPIYQQVLKTGLPLLNWEVSGEKPNQPGSQGYWLMSYFPIIGEGDRPSHLGGVVVEISDRKQAEAELRSARARLQHLLDYSPAVIYSCKASGDYAITFISDNVSATFGYEVPDFLADPGFWSRHIHPEDVELVFAGLPHLFETGYHFYEYRFLNAEGHYRWVRDELKVVRDEEGDPIECVGCWLDITERKQVEVALQQQLKREQLVGTVLERLRSSLNLEDVLNTAVGEVRQFLQTDRTVIYRFHPDWNGSVVVESVEKGWMPIIGIDIQDRCFTDTYVPLYQKGRVCAVADIHQAGLNECHQNVLVQLQVKANLVAPILCGEKLWGLLIAHHCSGPRDWQTSEIECLRQISVQLAIAIQQSSLFEQAKNELNERRQAELALRDSEARERSKALQLEITLQKLKNTQAQLIQNEKMVSLGQLVAGVAHEINNPVNFIYGNLSPARDYSFDLLKLVRLYQQHYPQPSSDIAQAITSIDLEYLAEDLPKLFNSMKVGADRIREIVKSLRNFSRLDEAEMKFIDIHEGIESTLMILQHRLKASGDHPAIQVVKKYDEELPKVECYAGPLNQVFMNILANAIDALEERDRAQTKAEQIRNPSVITIRTFLSAPGWVAISLADNGTGIQESVRSRLFDPFFTTKPVGKGTGLGLSISHSIIVEKHGGRLTCISELGQGSEFLIEIPIR